jgi:PAS domain S-box-containing protein
VPKNILVVEDDGVLAAHLRDLLKNLGHEMVGPVETGAAALRISTDNPPDLILMDIELAGERNDIESAAAIHDTIDVPVVYLTSYSRAPLAEQAKSVSPYGYLIKPVLERELAATIEMAIQRHDIERRLRVREAELSTLIANVPGAVYRCEVEEPWRVFEMSEGVRAITGRAPREFMDASITWADIVDPGDLPAVTQTVAEAVEARREYQMEYRLIHADGSIRWVHESGRCIFGPNGKPQHLDGVVLDVTSRRVAEQAIVNANAELAAIHSSVPVALVVLDEDRRVCKVNNAAAEAGGQPAEALVGLRGGEAIRCLRALDNPAGCGFGPMCGECPLRKSVVATLADGLQRENIEAWLPIDTGPVPEMRCLLATVTLLHYDGERKVLVSVQDITERKRAESELIAERAELQAVYDHAPTMMCVLDADHRVLYSNRAFSAFVGEPGEPTQPGRACSVLGCIQALSDGRGCGLGAKCDECGLRLAMQSTLESGVEHRDVGYRGTLVGGPRDREVVLLGSTSLIQGPSGKRLLLCLTDVTEQEEARRLLRESEEKHRTVVENAPVGIIVAQDGMLRFANQRAADFTGSDRQERPAGPLEQWIHPDDREMVKTYQLERQSGGRTPAQYDFRILDRQGNPRWLTQSGVRTEWEGRPATLSFLTDVTEQRRLASDYRSLFENMLDGFATHQIILDDAGVPVDYRFLAVNPAFERITGLSAAHIVGQTVRAIFPQLEPVWISKYGQVVLTGESVRFEDYSAELGKWFEVYAFRTAPDQFAAVIHDSTLRVQALAAMRLSEERYRQVSSAISDVAFSCSLSEDGSPAIDWLTGATERITGYTVEEMVALRCWGSLVVEEDRPVFHRNVAQLAPGEASSCELRIRHKDGRIRWLACSAERDQQSAGSPPAQLFGGLIDITERKSAELRYKAVWERSIDPMRLTDKDGVIVQVNDAFVDWCGIPKQELEGSLFTCIYREDLREAALAAYRKRVAGNEIQSRMDRRMTMWDGREIWLDSAIGILETEQGPLILSVLRETTESKRMEQALRTSEARFSQVAEQSMEMIWETDAEGFYTYVSEACVRLLGYRQDEIVGRRHFRELLPEEDRTSVSAVVRPIIEARGSFSNFQNRLVTKDGRVLRVLTNGAPILGPDGHLLGYRGADRDVTEQKLAEERIANVQRLESVGRLAGGVAHDFNNLLTVINGYSELVLGKLNEMDPLRAHLEEIAKAGNRAAGLTAQLLAFSRKQVLEPRVLDLNRVIGEMATMLRRLVGEDITVHLELKAQVGPVLADRSQMEQVVMNLAVNARDAMPDGGELQLRTYTAQCDELLQARYPGARPGSYTVLAVSDDGEGMDEATRIRAFEPFFTTKKQGKGTGLGLSMVHGIVEQSNGFIEVRSAPREGTTFLIYLPVTSEAPDSAEAPDSGEPAKGRETILLVEDEPEVRRFAAESLRECGYQVIEAAGGGEALIIAAGLNERIDLLLTDVVMPKLSGKEVATHLRLSNPRLKVLYMSGYADDVISPGEILSSGASLIRKPFGPQQLAAEVRAVLGMRRC